MRRPPGLFVTLVLLAPCLRHLAAEPADLKDQSFRYKGYKETLKFFADLKSQYPDIVDTWFAQDVYPSILPDKKVWGTCEGEPCKTLIVRIADKRMLTNSTPEVFFSGALHGDERIGPLTVTELARFLCEQYHAKQPDVVRLVKFRATWIMPMTNAHGYAHSRRAENGMDPNRDFPYLQKPDKCMTTQTARSVNELFRRHLFHYMITFHGGMRALTYEWGSLNHMKHSKSTESPDDAAFTEVGALLRTAAGKDLRRSWWYPLGRINDLVYPVDGGMEDWSYGAGFEASPKPITVCRPKTYGGYDASRTKYRKDSLSTLVYLAETDDWKIAPEDSLGHSADIWRGRSATQGHVPRNLRMCLKLIEFTRPEIVIDRTTSLPSSLLPGQSVVVHFHGFGCQELTSARLLAVPQAAASNCQFGSPFLQLDDASHARVLAAAIPIVELHRQKCRGMNIWEEPGHGTLLQLKGPLPEKVSGKFCLVVAADFDQHWGQQKHPDPSVRPRAHASRIRVDDSYSAAANDGEMRILSQRTKLFAVQEQLITVASPALAAPGPSSEAKTSRSQVDSPAPAGPFDEEPSHDIHDLAAPAASAPSTALEAVQPQPPTLPPKAVEKKAAAAAPGSSQTTLSALSLAATASPASPVFAATASSANPSAAIGGSTMPGLQLLVAASLGALVAVAALLVCRRRGETSRQPLEAAARGKRDSDGKCESEMVGLRTPAE